MKQFSIIFLKSPNAGVYHYTLSFRLVYSMAGGGILILMALSYLYYFQYQQIIQQQKIIEEQELSKATLQQEIGAFSDKEERISFLEDYVEELNQAVTNSETALKKHLALTYANRDKLAEINSYLCKVLASNCIPNLDDPNNPHQVISWMEGVYQNIQQFDLALQQFSTRKITFEEQATRIKQLQLKIAQTERDLAGHLQFVKSKGETIDQLSKQIRKVTGVTFHSPTAKQIRKRLKKTGRGGPTSKDRLSLNAGKSMLHSKYLRQLMQETSEYYDEAVQNFEMLSLSIEQNYDYWRNTPTILPIKGRVISDDYGVRVDPFTKRRAFHSGTDFVAKRGAPVYAPADGVVRYARSQFGFGLYVEIKHGLGFYPRKKKPVRYSTRYGHLSQIKVKKGQHVKRGDLLGLVGSTGRSTGPHLHYEVLVNGRHTNPTMVVSHFSRLKFLRR